MKTEVLTVNVMGVIGGICGILLVGCAPSDDSIPTEPSIAEFRTTELVVDESNVLIDIEVSRDTLGPIGVIPVTISGTATSDDYRVVSGIPVEFEERSRTADIKVELIADAVQEVGESVIFTLESTSGGGLDENVGFYLGIKGDALMNDTGITKGPGADSDHGRDTQGSALDGVDGFSFLALDNSGNPSNEAAVCVRDEITGQVWEVKSQMSDIHSPLADLTNANNQFSWFNPDQSTNGGNAGFQQTEAGNTCSFPLGLDVTGLGCDTQSYVDAVNEFNLCGFKNWRLPDATELMSIMDFEPTMSDATIEVTLFRPVLQELSEAGIDLSNVTDEDIAALNDIVSRVTTETEPAMAEVLDGSFWPFLAPGLYATSTPAADGAGTAMCVNVTMAGPLLVRCNKQESNMHALLTRDPTPQSEDE